MVELKLTEWDNDVPPDGDDYSALLNTLRLNEGFGLFFVRCSPQKGTEIVEEIRTDLPQKKIRVLKFEKPIEDFYAEVEKLEDKAEIDILFVSGLEHSLRQYEEARKLTGWSSKETHHYSWKGVPRLLINLNQQRERFRDDFNFSFVLLVPTFVFRYLLQRAPDFFDWRCGVFELSRDGDCIEKESRRIVAEGDYKEYLALTPQERNQKIIEIQELIEENREGKNCEKLFNELGALHGSCQEYEEAIASLDNALKYKPDKYEAWNNRGITLYKLGRDEEAIASFDNALKYKSDKYEAWNNRGLSLKNLGRDEEALASYENALKYKPDKYEAWHNQGISLGKLGRYEEALASYENALKYKPDLHEAWHNRGISLGKLGRYEEALASYENALKYKPDYREAWHNRGLALANLGRYEEAIASIDNALKYKPDDDVAWNYRGLALANLGRYEEAIASFDNALKYQPDYHEALYNKACAYAQQGNLDRALENLQHAIALNPEKYREMAKTEPDFDSIREDERFQVLLESRSTTQS
ncbi:tetratricopeptide repeat protein [Oscillatoria sp. FACHB-1406]|uniref:tetratricopeptide repeat protein n=1 Tax=Oscillatoria sp. FACHB-1406 TaxID=2692846 RepID=UPI001683AD47|nr:tetratricopeptide repeat protein [Oscillatoria sp. FACHB-1406]MBD2580536.1 tetratricopeptide repeat protein [Oscillatoria sp. FACHB-1406]